jgi:hypothetical protein
MSSQKEDADARQTKIIQEIETIQNKSAFALTFKKVYNDFQHFMFSNKIIVGATSFAIGVATKDVIEQVMTLLLLPLLKAPLIHLRWYIMKAPFVAHMFNKKMWIAAVLNSVGNVLWSLLLWLTVIIFAFFLLEYFLNRKIVGVISKVATTDEKEFVAAKVAAKEEPMVPILKEDVEKTKTKMIEEKVKEASHLPGISMADKNYGVLEGWDNPFVSR